MLETSVEKQLALLQQAKRSVVEVATARRRLELRAAKLRDDAAAIEGQARQAVAAGRDELARGALKRKNLALSQARELDGQIAELRDEEQQLASAESRLAARVEDFRTRTQLLRARRSAASAQVRVAETVAGVTEESRAVEGALRRAETHTAELRARGAALEEMERDGLLDAEAAADGFDARLRSLGADDDAERELAAMKQSLAAPRPQTERDHSV